MAHHVDVHTNQDNRAVIVDIHIDWAENVGEEQIFEALNNAYIEAGNKVKGKVHGRKEIGSVGQGQGRDGQDD